MTQSSVDLTLKDTLIGMRKMAMVSMFVIPFGIAFGAAALERGLSAEQSIFLSALAFAGAAQFAVLEIWADPMPFTTLALLVLAVNARHIILGAALSPWVNQLSAPKQIAAMTLLSDANFANTHQTLRGGHQDLGMLLGGGLMLWGTWIVGTTVGALLGDKVGPLEPWGVDVVMASFFMSTLIGAIRPRLTTTALPVGIAIVVAVVSAPWVPSGWNIILAALCGGLAGMWGKDHD